MHIESIVLSCVIFICWGFIGYCIVDLLGRHLNATRRWLLTPIVGVSASTLVAVILSRLGLPAKSFALPLLAALLVGSAIYWFVRRPLVDWRRAAVWSGGLVVVMLFVSWPLLVAGTNWVSLANGDMAHYLLGADHLYAHGFYDLPRPGEIVSERDASWDESFGESMGEIRFGAQLVLAWFMGVTSLNAAQGYMILLAAFHLVVLSSTAALVCSNEARERIAFATLVVVGSSANLAFGTLAQLMPQDFGLALVAASAAVLLDRPASGSHVYGQAGLAGILLATLLVAYSEAVAFLLVPIALYFGISLVKRDGRLLRWLGLGGLTAAFTLVCGNVTLVGAIHHFLETLTYSAGGGAAGTNDLFPYYLTPIGFSIGWGFSHLAEPGIVGLTWTGQASILIGILLYACALLVTIRQAWKLESIALVALTMLLVFAPLYHGRNGFGLFKLAMYAQPFVLGAMLLAIGKVFGSTNVREAALS